jgi:hypothetical protein
LKFLKKKIKLEINKNKSSLAFNVIIKRINKKLDEKYHILEEFLIEKLLIN